MKNSLIILIWATIAVCACGQRSKPTNNEAAINSKIIDSTKHNNSKLPLIDGLDKYIYTDTTYTFSSGKSITIQNSFPKGGSIERGGKQYVDSTGKNYAFAVFWTRIINETSTAVEFKINFPADSFAIFSSPNAYLKLLLPTDTMTFDKLSSFNYGLTGVKSFLDNHLEKSTMLHKTINPNEEAIFYIATITYQAGGTPRAAMILKEQDLHYQISIAPHGAATIPCGEIIFLNR